MRLSTALFPILLGCTALTAPLAARAQPAIMVSITVAPPALPAYVQPPIPGEGYVWTPGWWQYGPEGYYWVPGTWVQPPMVGLLWTPGYWAWSNGFYVWNAPYWGRQVGYYGGINYGYGYGGNGYSGGRWNNGRFEYNRAVNNFGRTTIRNVYNQPVPNHEAGNHTSFNGGRGGVNARPTQQQLGDHGPHTAPTAMQMQHVQAAGSERGFLATQNHGRPPVAVTSRPGEFGGQGGAPSRSGAPGPAIQPHGEARPGEARPGEARPGEVHPGPAPMRPPVGGERQAPPGAGQPQCAPGPAIEQHPQGQQPAQHAPMPAARPVEPQQVRPGAPGNEHMTAPPARPMEPQQARPAQQPQARGGPPSGAREEKKPE